MRVLADVKPSREQLPIVLNDRPGVAVIRGAAGSGKTTTAILRLRQLCASRRARRIRLRDTSPVRVLVLTYNRSLAGYVQELAQAQVAPGIDLDLTVSTFAAWAQSFKKLDVMSSSEIAARARRSSAQLGLTDRYIVSELDYVLGRFPSDDLHQYLSKDRDGRGSLPRVDKARMLEEIVLPYVESKRTDGVADWHDVTEIALHASGAPYDIVICDEAQDFSANQLRAVQKHISIDSSLTLVLDTAQRIYPRYYTWREAGLDAAKFVLNNTLSANKRNTRQIAAFARSILTDIPMDDNGELPDLASAESDGPLPQLFAGAFSEQAIAIVDFLQSVDLTQESVGILHTKGGGWFDYLRDRLADEGLPFVDLEQNRQWPSGPTNIALSTLHSAKGLEFDHVIVCGLTSQTATGGQSDEDGDDQNLRRLLAMGFGRAKSGLLVCYDPASPPRILARFAPGTYIEVGRR